MKVCVLGMGYIGLPTIAVLANHNMNVLGVDINKEVVDTVNKGLIHIKEPGLEKLIKEGVKSNKIRASLVPEEADVFIIAVPTPNNNDKYFSCDLDYVLKGIKMIMPYLKKHNLVIIESTIPPLTTEQYIKPLIESLGFKVGLDIYLVHSPERVIPGAIIAELIHNNRVVGGITPKCADIGKGFYKRFVKGDIIKTDAKVAELSKLSENTFRDINIAFANELTLICRELNINVLEVIDIANKHPRVNIHKPGPGVGGHCIPVDPYFIYSKAPNISRLIKLARDINNYMPKFVVKNINELIKPNSKISVFGITYKANVDDIRNSPALEIIRLLRDKGYKVEIYDPYIKEYSNNLNEVLNNSNLLLILADHKEYKNLDYKKVSELMQKPLIFDTRNCLDINNKDIEIINYGNIYKLNEIKKV
ncbi:MAG: nucleotide sugar dehydrogenase [Bacilli bacterium]|nr:nucleotide sugar dehydrogenase [Bacilli bacterium]